ncbi:MAG: CoA ester lyase [Candidatus Eremiobacteraeota bacterium]|nr:CoA ester lyase [Candidatus Eremiobacteraeota bacterium]
MLFAPGNHPRRTEKTLELETDGVILDLEDAVAISEKEAAREPVLAYLKRPRGNRKAYIRVNALTTTWGFRDIETVVVPGLDGLIVPKIESGEDLVIVDYLVSTLERERGIAAGTVDVIPILETAKGIDGIREISRAIKRVRRLAFGSGDFTNDTGTEWSPNNPLTRFARSVVPIASRAAGLDPPFDTVWPRIDQPEGLLSETEEARGMGYGGKMAIHPSQLETINRVFSPSRADIELAQKICDAFAAAEKSGAAAIVVDGIFVDYPVVYRARQTLESAKDYGLV